MTFNRIHKMVGLILLAFMISYVLIFCYLLGEKEKVLMNYSERLHDEYDMTISIYSNMSDLVYWGTLNKENVLNLLKQAYDSESEIDKNYYRIQLYEELEELFLLINKYNFHQIHFHENNNRSFLRLHKPDMYGDDLTGIRQSVEYVNRERQPVSGFEEGRIFNGYRFVYPLSYQGDALGSVEVSVSIRLVIDQLFKKYHQKTQFILSKSHVEKKVLHSEIGNYMDWPLNNNFVLDKEISSTFLVDNSLSLEDRSAVSRMLSDPEIMDSPFSLMVSYQNNEKILAFLPIKNLADETIAYILTLNSNEKIQEIRHFLHLISFAYFLLMLFFISFILYYCRSDKVIEGLIIYDQLTGAFTRTVILEKALSEMDRYKRYSSPFCLAMVDIDHFKRINDSYGHLTGDSVLRELSALILNNLRKTDSFGRYGGEEFLLILEESSGKTTLTKVDKLRSIIAEHSFDIIGNLTVSCGIAPMDEDIRLLDQLIERADQKLYEAKENGRNRVIL